MIGWAIYSTLSAAMMSIFFVMSSIAFAQGSPLTPAGGLLQGLTLAVGFVWMALLGRWSWMRSYPSLHRVLHDLFSTPSGRDSRPASSRKRRRPAAAAD